MRKQSRNWGKVVAIRTLQAMTLGFLLSAAVCHAQCAPPPGDKFASGNFELVGWNNKTVLTYGSPKGSTGDGSLIEGKTVNLVLSIVSGPGSFQPAGPGPGYGSAVYAYFNVDQGSYVPGAWSPVITFCNINIIDARDVGFSVTATGGLSPNGEQLWFCFEGAGWDFMDILIIENASPPKQPSPAPTPYCPYPAYAPVTDNTPVSPSVWFAGKTYPIVISGTGFTTEAAATASCPATQITINVNAGSVKLSDVRVLDSTTITAVVEPADTDPTETAEIDLWGPQLEEGGLASRAANAAPMASPATPMALNPIAPAGLVLYGDTTAQIYYPTLKLERIDLMDIKATGTPNVTGTSDSSAFSYTSVSVTGSTIATVGYASGSNAQSNPTFYQLTEPDNPDPKGNPSPGGLENITVRYTVDGVSSADKSFNVPTFGMSCYSTALESDYGLPPNGCRAITLFGTRYSGAVNNPGSLTGTYCLAFVEDVILNLGSGVLDNGIAVQKVNGQIGPTPDGKIHTADTPVPVPFQTVARDRRIIPDKGVLIDLDQVGTGIHADDTGKKGYITGYRLDLYEGIGKSACANNDNIMAVGACTPKQLLCPASAIQ